MELGELANEQKVVVILSKADHVSQLVFSFPLKNKMVSHPIKAWNMGKATEHSSPSAFTIC